MASKATADQPSPAAQDKQRMQQVQFILPPELAVSGSSEGSSVREQDYDDHQMEDGASDQVCTRNSKKKGHPLVVQFATPTSSSRRGIQEEDGPRGSICDELLESGSTKILTIPVGGSNYKRREYEQELPARRETTQENKNQTNEESSRGLHNSASLWIIIWVLNNLAITLTNKVAYNEPVDFKYPYFLSAHHMAFIAMGTNFVFWCLERHSMEPSEEEDAAGVEEVELHAMEDWPSELESVATIQTSMEDTDSSCKQGSDRDNQSGSKGSKERKIEQDVVLQQKLLLLQPKVTQEKPSKTKQPPSWITTLFGDLEKKELDAKGKRLILAYSVLFSANLCIGNVSLIYVSVNFNQVMRSLVPAVTIFMGYFINKPTSFQRQIAVIPVIVGVAMACFGDMSFSTIGFGYTSLCVFLAALKVVASGEILTGDLKLHPFDLLRHMTPLALVQCLIMSIATGEVQEILQRWPTDFSPWGPKGLYPSSIVNLTGLISLTFNVSSLQVNKLTSPLTLCVAANVKQVLMIGIATAVFETEISPLNAAGIAIVLAGSAWYSYVSSMEKAAAKALGNRQTAIRSSSARSTKNRMMDLESSGRSQPLRYLSFATSSSSVRQFLSSGRRTRTDRSSMSVSSTARSSCWGRTKSCWNTTRIRLLLISGLFGISMYANPMLFGEHHHFMSLERLTTIAFDETSSNCSYFHNSSSCT